MKLILEKDLNELNDWVNEQLDDSRYPGMTYERGIRDVVLWLLGEQERPDKLE